MVMHIPKTEAEVSKLKEAGVERVEAHVNWIV